MPPTGCGGPKQGLREPNSRRSRSRISSDLPPKNELSGCWTVSELHQSDTEDWLTHDAEQYFSGGTVAACCDLTPTILSRFIVHGEADEPKCEVLGLDINICVAVTEKLRCDYHGPHHLWPCEATKPWGTYHLFFPWLVLGTIKYWQIPENVGFNEMQGLKETMDAFLCIYSCSYSTSIQRLKAVSAI